MAEPLLAIVNSLAPVFLVIALGWVLRRKHFISPTAVQDMARLTYWVGLPCLLFYKITVTEPALGEAGSVLLVTAGATAVGILLSYSLARWLGVPGASMGTFVQAGFRGNLAFVGLPVIIYAFSESGHSAAAEVTALLVFGPMVVFYNVAAVLVLLFSRAGINSSLLGKIGKELLINPLFIACLAGVLCSLLQLPLPLLVERSLAAIGQMALPLALLCLGGSLVAIQMGGGLVWSANAAMIKLAIMPLLGYGIACWINLSPEGTRIALILLACPTATVSYILVNQIGGDAALAAGAILLSTLLATLPLALVLALT